MAELPPRRRVEDVALLRALAHPLRASLVRHLAAVGPCTASECATELDSTASNCSWHLRKLAEFGLVERVDAEDGRERPWRACQVGLELGELGTDTDPARRTAQLGATAAFLADDHLLTQRFLDTVDELDPAWAAAAGLSSYALRVTAAELAELVAAIDALVRPYVAPIRTDAPAAARPVHLGLRAFPRITAAGRPAE